MFGIDLSKPIPPAPNCHVCDAPAGEDHAKGCNWLAAMRAQEYPQVLGDNGQPWYMNAISKLQKENDFLREALKSSNKSDFSAL